MTRYIFYFACILWAASLLVHVLAANGVDVQETLPAIWLLHVGAFAAFFPAVREITKDKELAAWQETHKANRANVVENESFFNFYRPLFRHVPPWLLALAIVSFGYAMVNASFFVLGGGTPAMRGGQYLLENHSALVKTLTEQEYHLALADEPRGFSGHWMLFYGVSAALLYPFNKTTSIS